MATGRATRLYWFPGEALALLPEQSCTLPQTQWNCESTFAPARYGGLARLKKRASRSGVLKIPGMFLRHFGLLFRLCVTFYYSLAFVPPASRNRLLSGFFYNQRLPEKP